MFFAHQRVENDRSEEAADTGRQRQSSINLSASLSSSEFVDAVPAKNLWCQWLFWVLSLLSDHQVVRVACAGETCQSDLGDGQQCQPSLYRGRLLHLFQFSLFVRQLSFQADQIGGPALRLQCPPPKKKILFPMLVCCAWCDILRRL